MATADGSALPSMRFPRWQVINQFCAFLLEQLSKEAREAAKEAAKEAAERADAAKKRQAKRERDLLVGAVPSDASGPAKPAKQVAATEHRLQRLLPSAAECCRVPPSPTESHRVPPSPTESHPSPTEWP